jgi:hypothetical protein
MSKVKAKVLSKEEVLERRSNAYKFIKIDMSYDLILIDGGGDEVYETNMTFNVSKMARALGIYEGLFNHGWGFAYEAIIPLRDANVNILRERDLMEHLEVKDWGSAAQFQKFLLELEHQCRSNPMAVIKLDK